MNSRDYLPCNTFKYIQPISILKKSILINANRLPCPFPIKFNYNVTINAFNTLSFLKKH